MTDARRRLVGEHIARLRTKHGRVTPDIVVRDARNPQSPLHAEFEWDDSKAAERYRIEQARDLIRSVYIVTRTDATTIRSVAYVRDPNALPHEQGYVSVESLRGDPVAAREALLYECEQAAAHVARCRTLAVALGITTEVDAILDGLGALREKIAA